MLVLAISFLLWGWLAPAEAASRDYRLDWQGTHYLVNDMGLGSDLRTAIGVGQLKMTGGFTNGPFFKEIWSTSAMPKITPPTPNRDGLFNFDGGWLLGIIKPHNIGFANIINFALITKAEFDPLPRQLRYNYRGLVRQFSTGPAQACEGNLNNEERDCLIPHGQYTFSRWHDFPVKGKGKPYNIVTAMPIRWVVTGKVCDEAVECQ